MGKLHFIFPGDPPSAFPPVGNALTEPNGLLAVGGDLTPERLLSAYSRGIFPWFNEGEPILWWSPDPRLVMLPGELHVSRSLRKTLARNPFDIRFNTAFKDVMLACAQPRKKQAGTWISEQMVAAYHTLHTLGHAHSIEAWRNGELVGGLYGVAIGKVFFGESMFTRVPDASKVAFVHFIQHITAKKFELVDCQVATEHLISLGAREIPRSEFVTRLREWCLISNDSGSWHCRPP